VTEIALAVIGGSGFYDMPGLEQVEERHVDTPFGPPSDTIRLGTLDGARVAFLARHGRGHRLLPSELPQRANIWALKALNVRRVLAVSAVGGLREETAPGHFVLPHQFIDRTMGRAATYFGDGVVAHVSFADPVCRELSSAAFVAASQLNLAVHGGGTYVCIEGPAFGTRAESHLYRSWGADVVGMTALPEAKLAREAELCYAVVTAVTDYDAWHETHVAVDAATVFKVLGDNVGNAQRLVRALLQRLPAGDCLCQRALDTALVTPPAAVDAAARARLGPIIARRLGEGGRA
jgi:5'-methylthioadenosine phosphorylase